MSLWKTWSDVRDKMVVEEGLTWTWLWRTMHQRRASGSLGVEKLYVIEKVKWMFNPRIQAIHEESYITRCQSLLNQDMKWCGDQKWKLILWCEVLQVTTSKSQCQSKIKCGNPHKVKKKWSGKNQPCASSSWREVFYILSWLWEWRSIKRDTIWIDSLGCMSRLVYL
jgi:hypothetical protein